MISRKVVGSSSLVSTLPALGRLLGVLVLWVLGAHLSTPYPLGKFTMGLAIALPLFLGSDWPRGNRGLPKGLFPIKILTLALILALIYLGVWTLGLPLGTAHLMVLGAGLVAALSIGRTFWQIRRQGFSPAGASGIWGDFKSLHPFGLVRALGSLILLIPLYLLAGSHGFYSLGLLAPLGFWIFLGPWFLEIAHSQWGGPWKGTLENKGTEAFCHQFFKTLGLYAVAAIMVFSLLLLGGEAMVGRVFGSAYERFTDAFLWLSLSGMLFGACALFCLGLTAAGGVADKVSTLSFWVLLQLIFSFLLIPNMGIGGVAWTLCLMALLMVASQVITLEHRLKRQAATP